MQLDPIPRRRLLKLVTVSAVAVGTAATLVYTSTDKSELNNTEFGQFVILNESTAKTLFAMVEVTLPESFATNQSLVHQVLFRVDEEFSLIESKTQEDLNLGLTALEYLPLAFGWFSRFSNLPMEKRKDFLASVSDTQSDTIRAVINNCRIIPLYIFYGLDVSWQQIGYDGSFSRLKPIVSQQRQHYSQRVGRKTG